MIDALNSLPLIASVWIIGLSLIWGLAAILSASLSFFSRYRGRGAIEITAPVLGLVLNAWIIVGLPLTYIVGGSAAYEGDTGGWIFLSGMLGLAFASGIVGNALDVDDQWLFRPIFYSVLAGIPLFLIALATGLIPVGSWFLVVLFGVSISLIGFFSWGPVGLVLAAAPAIAFLLVVLSQ